MYVIIYTKRHTIRPSSLVASKYRFWTVSLSGHGAKRTCSSPLLASRMLNLKITRVVLKNNNIREGGRRGEARFWKIIIFFFCKRMLARMLENNFCPTFPPRLLFNFPTNRTAESPPFTAVSQGRGQSDQRRTVVAVVDHHRINAARIDSPALW